MKLNAFASPTHYIAADKRSASSTVTSTRYQLMFLLLIDVNARLTLFGTVLRICVNVSMASLKTQAQTTANSQASMGQGCPWE